jgi:hypothetical protein
LAIGHRAVLDRRDHATHLRLPVGPASRKFLDCVGKSRHAAAVASVVLIDRVRVVIAKMLTTPHDHGRGGLLALLLPWNRVTRSEGSVYQVTRTKSSPGPPTSRGQRRTLPPDGPGTAGGRTAIRIG